MKFISVLSILSLAFVLCQCSEHVRINTDGTNSSPATTTSPVVEITSKNVRVAYTIQSDFPKGAIRPDVVYMDGKVLVENSFITTGNHTFVIEKKGYQQKNVTVMVEDSDGDGMFNLQEKLDSKDRLVIFDLKDNVTNAVLQPDLVSAVDTDEGEKKQNLADRCYIKPGRKKLVIQKAGYTPISVDINVKADEDPYIIQYKLTPEKK